MKKTFTLVPLLLFLCTFVFGQTAIWHEPIIQGGGSVTFCNSKTVTYEVNLGADITAGDIDFTANLPNDMSI